MRRDRHAALFPAVRVLLGTLARFRARLRGYTDVILASWQILTGTKYASKHLTRPLRRIYRSTRASHPEQSRNEAIYAAACIHYVLESTRVPEKKHQYSRLIDEITGQPNLDFSEVAFRLAQIDHGIIGVSDSDTEALRRNIQNELKRET